MRPMESLSLLFLCILASCSGNEPPRFVLFMDNFFMNEKQPVGSLLYTLNATDEGPVKYYTDADVFRVVEDTGEVFLTRPLDYETGEIKITVRFIAFDEEGLSDEVEPTINVIDANDNPPKFRRNTYKQKIPEDFTVQTDVISNLKVNDVDYSGQIIEVLCDPNSTLLATNTSIVEYRQYVEACETFEPRSVSASNREWLGNIVLLKPLDFETRPTYQIPLVTFDGLNRHPQSFEILLIDVNDAPPRFTYVPETITIKENRPVGTNVGQVIAIDGDKNNPRAIRYVMTPCPESDTTRKNGSDIFSIDLVSGNITTKANIDRENPLFLTGVEICIKARELIDNRTGQLGDDAQTTSIATIRIDVEDLNDQTPSFDSTSYNTSIYEDIVDGSAIPGVALTVSDLDGYPANSYDIQLINYKDIFEAFPTNGSGRNIGGIKVKDTSQIDYETGPRKFELYIIAKENIMVNGQRPNTGSTTVTIHVLDVNDNTPIFRRSVYNASVKETDRGVEPFIKTISATDPDSGSMGTTGVVYSLLGSEFERFQIAPTSFGAAAEMRVTSCATPGRGQCLDYERRRRYDFTVVAEDLHGQGRGRKGTAQLIIHIIDENDSDPIFYLNSYVGNIREGERRTVNPLFVTANDTDTRGEVVYSLTDSDQARYWQIDPQTGLITATEPIYYSLTPGERGWFTITVLANDSVNVATANVTINVIDLNNFAPEFQLQNYFTSIPEDTIGDVSLITVTAMDRDSSNTDNGKVEYNIVLGAQGKFVIDANTGLISTAPDATFDYDLQQQYLLRVLARDGGNPQQTGTTSVTISIIDQNNKAPYFTPQVQIAEIVENAPIDQWVTTILAKDPDKDANLTFALIEPINAITPDGVEVDRNAYDYTTLFKLTPSTGEVRVARNLDRDLASVITFTMSVTDISDPSRQQTGLYGRLIIRIKEYNDQSPTFLQPVYNLTVEEEQAIGTFIIALVAQDADDFIRQYEILERDQDFFSIIPDTGVLTVKRRIDYEQVTRTEFTVRATDTGEPPRSGEAKVYVEFTNVNDNSPIPTQNTYTVHIQEHSPAGTSVLQVTASDKDKGDYGVVRYSLPEDNFQFNIDPITGEMTLANGVEFDRETQSEISTRIIVYDSPLDESVRRRYTVPVYVYLDDINDNYPIFSASDYVSAEIIESIDIGAQILQIFAEDKDFGINAALRYQKVPGSGDPQNYFDVTPFSGQIIVAQSLRGRIGTYKFNVSASDLNGAPGNLTGYATVTIKVIESLNSAPVWFIPSSDNMTVEVLESQYLGMLVFDVHANDTNSGNNGIVEYFIQDAENVVSKTAEFSINRVTGVIRAEIIYDRETVSRYTLHLVVRDKGDRPLRADRFLNIMVVDVNDNKPEFPMSNGQTIPQDITVWENATVGTVIGSVSAIDRDLPEYSKIYYSIIAGAQGKFAIDSQTGAIRLIDTVDRENQGNYSLEVRASNGEHDYSVITQRKRRSTDPSTVTVRVTLQDVNDEAPQFVNFNGENSNSKEYHGCIASNSPFDQPVVQLSAVDADQVGSGVVRYSIASGNTDNAFKVDEFGMIRNSRLLNTLNQRIYYLNAAASDERWTTTAPVKVFITESGNVGKLVINQKPSDVELFRQQIARLVQSLDGITYSCIMRITNHVVGDNSINTKSDVSMVAVVATEGGGYRMLSSTDLLTLITADRKIFPSKYEALYVESVGASSEGYYLYERDALLAVLIITLLLIFLGILLLCIVCYCLREADKKRPPSAKDKVAFAYQDQEVERVNPVYGVVPVSSYPMVETEPKEALGDYELYAVVKKKPKQFGARSQLNPEVLEPYPFVEDDDTRPVIETIVDSTDDMVPQNEPTEVIVQVLPEPDYVEDDDGPMPVIETIIDTGDDYDDDPAPVRSPGHYDYHEPVITTVIEPADDPEPVITTVIEPTDNPEPVITTVIEPADDPEPVITTVIEPAGDFGRSQPDDEDVSDTNISDSQPEPQPELDSELDSEPDSEPEMRHYALTTPLEPLEERSERESQHDTNDEEEDVRSDTGYPSPPPSLVVERFEASDANSQSISETSSPHHTPPPSPGPYIYQGDDDV